MHRLLLHWLKDDHGATSAEYAIVAGFIAGVLFVAVTLLGDSVNTLFQVAQQAFSGG